MKVFITGITGMIGGAFTDALTRRGDTVVGIARGSASSRSFADHNARVIRCDLLEREAVARAIADTQPDLVLHLAAQAFNGLSWQMPDVTYRTNIDGTRHVLDAVRDHAPHAAVMIACSSAQYGLTDPAEAPLREDRLLRPISPYGVSKVAAECLGCQYAVNYGLKVFLPRLFIHVGVGHPPATAIQNFARQLAMIRHGHADPVLRVGALDAARDFIDVRDGVDGMLRLIADGPDNTPVNICTGRAWTIRQTLGLLIDIAQVDVRIEHDAALDRPSDEPVLVGDNARLKSLGWTQQIPFEQTLRAVFDDWLARTGEAARRTT